MGSVFAAELADGATPDAEADGGVVVAVEGAGLGEATADGPTDGVAAPQADTSSMTTMARLARVDRRGLRSGSWGDMPGIVARAALSTDSGGGDIAFLIASRLDPESGRRSVGSGRTGNGSIPPSLDRGRRLGRRLRSFHAREVAAAMDPGDRCPH